MSYQTAFKSGSFNLLNNQTTPVNITGLFVDSNVDGDYIFDYSIVRRGYTGGDITYKGTVVGRYNPIYLAWYIVNTINLTSGTAGTVTLSQLPSGQFQYVSTNVAGTPTQDKITWTFKLL